MLLGSIMMWTGRNECGFVVCSRMWILM